jgi:hypothetical protein
MKPYTRASLKQDFDERYNGAQREDIIEVYRGEGEAAVGLQVS